MPDRCQTCTRARMNLHMQGLHTQFGCWPPTAESSQGWPENLHRNSKLYIEIVDLTGNCFGCKWNNQFDLCPDEERYQNPCFKLVAFLSLNYFGNILNQFRAGTEAKLVISAPSTELSCMATSTCVISNENYTAFFFLNDAISIFIHCLYCLSHAAFRGTKKIIQDLLQWI